jgi:hypothetical protein
MYLNFLLVPVLLGAFCLGLLGFRVSSSGSVSSVVAWFGLAVVLAVPALLFATYYGHILDRAAWFYNFRAAPYTELTAAGLGFGLGLILGRLKQIRSVPSSVVSKLLPPIITLAGIAILLVPYIKPVIAPLEVPLQNRWSEGVCLQSTPSTCGPCSAITLLRQYSINASERDLARECFTYQGGTENWYVARALQRRGLQTHYLLTPPQPATLPFHSIAGVQLGGPGTGGHFITVLGRSGNRTIIGDPLVGKLFLTPKQLYSRYYFTGFFLVVRK